MQPYPRAPDILWPGSLHGPGCLSARAMDIGFPTVVWCLCLGLGCAWARVSAVPCHSSLGCWGLCVLVCVPHLHPDTPGWAVRCACVCLGSGFGCAPPLLAAVLGCVCVRVRAPLVPHQSWLGCAVWVCVFGLGYRLRPATPGWGVGVCVFACALRLYPATPGWSVRRGFVLLGSGFGCAPPLRAGVLGCVCVCVRVPLVPRHSWLGCPVRVGVLGPWLRLRPATPGWRVAVWACALCLYPATPGWIVLCGCVCWGSCFSCAPPLLAGVLGCACVRSAGTPPLLAGVLGCACVCLGLGFGCAPPLLAGVSGCVCLCARSSCTLPLLAGLLGCACVRSAGTPPLLAGVLRCACVCLGSGFGCVPPLLAGVSGCVCLCARSSCTPPLLARVCGVGVCAWAWVSAAPRHSWLGCWGLCVLVCALRLYPATHGWGVRCRCVCSGSGFG